MSRNKIKPKYKIIHLNSFKDDLRDQINRRRKLGVSEQHIGKFITEVYDDIRILDTLPFTHQNVADRYSMQTDTYEIVLSKRYAIFYRVNTQNNTVIIGSLFSSRQMRVPF